LIRENNLNQEFEIVVVIVLCFPVCLRWAKDENSLQNQFIAKHLAKLFYIHCRDSPLLSLSIQALNFSDLQSIQSKLLLTLFTECPTSSSKVRR
jgi:hypothetical protein